MQTITLIDFLIIQLFLVITGSTDKQDSEVGRKENAYDLVTYKIISKKVYSLNFAVTLHDIDFR